MNARVIGGNKHGGTDLEVGCPRLTDKGGSPRFVRCDAETDVTITAGGLLVVKADECPSCYARWSEAERETMKEEAQDAIDNFDPSDDDLAAESEGAYPTMGERRTAARSLK